MRISYIKKWGPEKYFDTLLRSRRFENLEESKAYAEKNDLGFFAEPARFSELQSVKKQAQYFFSLEAKHPKFSIVFLSTVFLAYEIL